MAIIKAMPLSSDAVECCLSYVVYHAKGHNPTGAGIPRRLATSDNGIGSCKLHLQCNGRVGGQHELPHLRRGLAHSAAVGRAPAAERRSAAHFGNAWRMAAMLEPPCTVLAAARYLCPSCTMLAEPQEQRPKAP